MTFLSGFVSYAVKFIIFAAVALGGVFAGKALREKRMRQSKAENEK